MPAQPEPPQQTPAPARTSRLPWALGALAAVVTAMALGAIYVQPRAPGNAPGQLAAGSEANAAIFAQLATGQMAAFSPKATLDALPAITFQDGAGKERSLADWQGKVVVLNLWATWCVPCRKEMPMLDKLQATLGSNDFEVVALNADRGTSDKAKAFFAETRTTALSVYHDKSGKSSAAVGVVGLPTTLLIDRKGREIGRLVGPAEWDSEEALALVKAALAAKG
jgi:thiol-disulfide isomerase/thioredoxin